MSDPYGGPFPEWDKEAAYAKGARVSFKGYIYEAMEATSANEKPGTATHSFEFVNRAVPGEEGGETVNLTLPKWRLWDYPAGYYMARLRGLPPFSLVDLLGNVPVCAEVRTVQMRSRFYVEFLNDYEEDIYDLPVSASYSGYGLPAAMDSNWTDDIPPIGTEPNTVMGGDLMWSFSSIRFEDGAPADYRYQGGFAQGICFSPTTIVGRYYLSRVVDVSSLYAVEPAWFTETQGQMISSYQTFSRQFDLILEGTEPSPEITQGFQDSWRSNPAYEFGADVVGPIIGTSPGYAG
jgi:hypothetical protein